MSEQSQPAGSGPAGSAEDSESTSVAPRRRGKLSRHPGRRRAHQPVGRLDRGRGPGRIARHVPVRPAQDDAGRLSRRRLPVSRPGHRPRRCQGRRTGRQGRRAGRQGRRAGRQLGPGTGAARRLGSAAATHRVRPRPGRAAARQRQPAVAAARRRARAARPSTLPGPERATAGFSWFCRATSPARRPARSFAGPGGNWVAVPGPACAVGGPGGLPWGHRMSVRFARPGALKRIASVHGRRVSINWVQVAPPQRVVIVGPGWRSVRTPGQVHLWMRPGKRLTRLPVGMVAPAPGPGPACVMIRPPR